MKKIKKNIVIYRSIVIAVNIIWAISSGGRALDF